MQVKSLHIVASLLEVLFPGHGTIVCVYPQDGTPGQPAIITNLKDQDVVDIMKQYIEKHKQGDFHVNDSKPLKN